MAMANKIPCFCCSVNVPVLLLLPRKRGLAQGNIFTGVCLFPGGGAGWLSSMHHRSHDQYRGVCLQGVVCLQVGSASGELGRTPPHRSRTAGGTHPTGMLSCYCNGFEITFVSEKHMVGDDVLFTNHLAGK